MRTSLLRSLIVGIAAWSVIAGPIEAGSADGTFVLHGRVFDRQGKAVAGAEVALYTSPDVRRPVDFMTPPTIENGSYAVSLPPGRYWAVARQRAGSRYGPLRPADRHSGTPVEIVGKAAETVTADFAIASIREMGEERQPSEPGTVKLKGRTIGKEGAPVAGAYLFAQKEGAKGGIPEFLSPAFDQSGETTLVLPPGDYLIGADVAFPPREGRVLKKVRVGAGSSDLVIQVEVP